MLHLVARHDRHVLRFPLPAGPVNVGSSSENDLVLPFPGVSRFHARLEPRGKGLEVRDLGSRNGLLVDGKPVKRARLEKGRALRVGGATLTIEEGDTSDVAVALKLESAVGAGPGCRNERETDSSGGQSLEREGSSGALRFVRDVEALGDRAVREERVETLKSARTVLGADALLVFGHGGDSGLSLEAVEGELPPEPVTAGLREASASPAGRRRCAVRDLDGWTALVFGESAEGARRAVVVAWRPGRGAVVNWQRDFFDYVAEKLLQVLPEPSAKRPGLGGSYPLVFPEGMVFGESDAISGLLAHIQATVRSRLDVLILGETGTGKELFARLIHASGPTPEGPFVAINCAAIPTELLESELFGVHGRVATGVDPHAGYLVSADGGTIFLDEIGDMAPALQAKLLRFLQEREVLPVGAREPRKVSLRVVSASNRDLPTAVKEGKFRADLFYRLRGLQFHIPPLRDRREDVPKLATAFAERAAREYGKRVKGISRKALDLLMHHDWPGNIRELETEVHRAVLLCHDGGVLHSDHFAPVRWAVEQEERKVVEPTTPAAEAESAKPAKAPAAAPVAESQERADGASDEREFVPLAARVEHVERKALEEALARANGNKSLAARLLGVTRAGLRMKLERLRARTGRESGEG